MAQSPGELTRVRFTNLEKILYPAIGATKKDVIGHYIRMAPDMLPFLRGRPVTMHRYPEGIGGEDFYEKDAPAGTPDFVDIFRIYSDTSERDVHFVLCNNLDTLLWLANLASIELHATLSTSDTYESPDLMLFDIDPEPPLPFDDVVGVAYVVRDILVQHGLEPYVKSSGKKGLHIVVPLIDGYRFTEVRDYAHTVGKAIARESPIVVSEFPHSRDPGTIFIDYLQNAKGKTMAAPYSLRATPAANVSSPLSWAELKQGIRPEDFNIRTMISRKEEPWGEIFLDRQKIGRTE